MSEEIEDSGRLEDRETDPEVHEEMDREHQELDSGLADTINVHVYDEIIIGEHAVEFGGRANDYDDITLHSADDD